MSALLLVRIRTPPLSLGRIRRRGRVLRVANSVHSSVQGAENCGHLAELRHEDAFHAVNLDRLSLQVPGLGDSCRRHKNEYCDGYDLSDVSHGVLRDWRGCPACEG